MHPARARTTLDRPWQPGPILYWMHRELRARDNWALIHARALAAERGQPLCVAFCLAPAYGPASRAHFAFMLHGLRATAAEISGLGMGFALLRGQPGQAVAEFARHIHAGLVVTDADPTRIKRAWLSEATARLDCALVEVDGRNVVPARSASDHREYMARTIRPKIQRLLPEFLTPYPALEPPPVAWTAPLPSADWDALTAEAGPPPASFVPGEAAAREALDAFVANGLARYAEERNTPLEPANSFLSPYLHFGQISAQRVALDVLGGAAAGHGTMKLPKGAQGGPGGARSSPWPPEAFQAPQQASAAAFLEQLIVRRELAENFCLYEPDYDTPDAFPAWARQTLEKHGADTRPHLASEAELEDARTPDALWNAAQRQLLASGHMHGWLRMYWAKQLLLWSPDAATAMTRAIRLNDSLSLDGRDVNGYAGVAWSIGGVHDRPWPERSVFGTVRSMTASGAARKFDAAAFIAAQNGGGVRARG
jgi:deoxyribodipyrimidine photo-lyase